MNDACEHAVALELSRDVAPARKNLGVVDSRGLARALTEDLAGAKEDFETFARWASEYKRRSTDEIRMREGWIAALEKGENPFRAEDGVLEELKEGRPRRRPARH